MSGQGLGAALVGRLPASAAVELALAPAPSPYSYRSASAGTTLLARRLGAQAQAAVRQ